MGQLFRLEYVNSSDLGVRYSNGVVLGSYQNVDRYAALAVLSSVTDVYFGIVAGSTPRKYFASKTQQSIDGYQYVGYDTPQSLYYNIQTYSSTFSLNTVSDDWYYIGLSDSTLSAITLSIDTFSSFDEFIAEVKRTDAYPITYSYTNSTVSGPSEAAVGDTVTVSAVPDVDYGITDPTTQIAVTNNDDPVNFTWDASTNRITFVMPDPS